MAIIDRINWYMAHYFDCHIVPTWYGCSHKEILDRKSNFLFYDSARKVITEETTYLGYDRLWVLYQGVMTSINNKPFNAIEIGVYKGGGSYFIASVLNRVNHPECMLYSVDTFTGHSALDIPYGNDGDHLPSQFNEVDYSDVCNYLADFPFVEVIKSRIQDWVSHLRAESVDFIHLDTDLYEPTLFSLNYFKEKITTGAWVIVDDYFTTTCHGVKRAVDKFTAGTNSFSKIVLDTGQCVLIKL